MAAVGFGPWLRDLLNARDARRMVRKRRFPETVERSYWQGTEYTRDAARLEALGYVVASEADNDPYVSATLPPTTGGTYGQLSRTIRRRVPSIHVIYRRTAGPD